MQVSNHLRQFARYVREHELDAMISAYLELVYQYKIPLLEHVRHLSETAIYEQSREGVIQFLKGFEDGTALERVKENIKLWEADQLPNVPKMAISALDIFLISTAQKVAFLKLLPNYAENAEIPTGILVEIEDYYKETQLLSLNALQSIQQEQKQQLIESEARYKNLFDNATDLIHIVSPEGKLMYMNNAWKRTLGYDETDLADKTVYDIVTIDDVERYRNCREKVLKTENQTGSVDITFISKAGTLVSVEDLLSAKFKDGKALYSQCIMRDVTRRNKAEAKLAENMKRLEESEENLRLLLENAPDAVVVVDRKMLISYWNLKAEKMFGWTAAEVKGKSFTDLLIPKRHQTQYEEDSLRFQETGEWEKMGVTIEMIMQDRNKRDFYVALTSSQSWQQGKDVYISFIRDIDQQKKVELELSEQRTNLEKANRELEQYAWLASHDLKEPLRKILTFSNMLVTRYSEGMDTRVVEGLNKINSSAYRMHDMIEAVFNYSRLASGTDALRLVDLSKVVADVLSDLEVQIHDKEAIINVSGLKEVEGDPVQMHQLFQNLVSNALKYSREGVAPLVEIKGQSQGGKLIITVEDNGIGFDEQYSEKMFQIFKRLVSKDEYQGTGIGLALCRKIILNHGGTITASSPEGKGAIFTVVLPLYQRG